MNRSNTTSNYFYICIWQQIVQHSPERRYSAFQFRILNGILYLFLLYVNIIHYFNF